MGMPENRFIRAFKPHFDNFPYFEGKSDILDGSHIISYHVMSNYLISSSYHIIFTPHDISTVVGFVSNIGKHPSSDPHVGNISTTLCPDLCSSQQRRLKEGLFLLHQSISPYAGDTCWEPRHCRMSQVVR